MAGDVPPGLLPEFVGRHAELEAEEVEPAVDLDEPSLADQMGQNVP